MTADANVVDGDFSMTVLLQIVFDFVDVFHLDLDCLRILFLYFPLLVFVHEVFHLFLALLLPDEVLKLFALSFGVTYVSDELAVPIHDVIQSFIFQSESLYFLLFKMVLHL